MSTLSAFDEIKSELTSCLQSYNLNETLINQILSNEFINGILELQQQEPANDPFLTTIRNFSSEENLNSVIALKKEFQTTLAHENYFTTILQYTIDSLKDIDIPTPTRSLSSSEETDITTEDVYKAGIITGITFQLIKFSPSATAIFNEVAPSAIMIKEAIEQEKKIWNILSRMGNELLEIAFGVLRTADGAKGLRSPLVLDLDGDGVETKKEDSSVHFDHDNNGFAESTGWVGKDDGLLVRDINGNGQIDDGTELFGNNTVLSSGQKAANGFEALKDLDSNNDGIFNNQDTAWNQVKVWKDSNSNGIVDDGELLSLEQAGVAGINLNYQNYRTVDINGNVHNQTGTFIKTDGSTGAVHDVWFETNKTDTVNKNQIEIPDDIKALPEVKGFGNVCTLQEAMAQDTTGALKTLVQQYMNEPNAAARKDLVKNIIFHWTGVQDIDPLSRKPSHALDNHIQDARYLEALECFWGEKYTNRWWFGMEEQNPHEQAAKVLLQAFQQIFEYVENKLEEQTVCKPLLENIKMNWNAETEQWDIDVSSAVNTLEAMTSQDSSNAKIMLHTLERIIKEQNILTEEINYAFQQAGVNSTSDIQLLLMNFGKMENLISSGDDIIYGTDNNDIINGLAGNDNIYGQAGNDTLIGGAGDDYLVGGTGSDTYFFEGNWGHDSIDNSSTDEKGANPDKIVFGEGILPFDVTIQRQGNDLILSLHDGADTIKVYSYFLDAGTTTNTVDTIEFSDGTVWNYDYVRVAWNAAPQSFGGFTTLSGTNNNDTINGTSGSDFLSGEKGNDTINAGDGNDVIYGGEGNDALYGGAGDDTYIWNWGDGYDTIYDTGNNDTISFGQGITFNDLKFKSIGHNLQIQVKHDPTQGILISNFFNGLNYKIENMVFTNGETIRLSEIPLTLIQDDTAEYIYGTEFGDTIYGNGGNDTIYANGGNDIIYGGTGNDDLRGGDGADTYVYNLGDGLDKIMDLAESTACDTIRFGAGITADDLSYRAEGSDLRIVVKGEETQGLILRDYISNVPSYSLSSRNKIIEFADGSTINLNQVGLTLQQTARISATLTNYDDIVHMAEVSGNGVTTLDGDDIVYGSSYADTITSGNGDDIIYGGAGNDTIRGENGNDYLVGGTGNDYLDGGDGNDTYVYNLGDGLDTIVDYAASTACDTIRFGTGITAADLSYCVEGYNLKIIIKGEETQGLILRDYFSNTALNSTSARNKIIEFADGSTINLNQIGLTLQQTARISATLTNYDDVVHMADVSKNAVSTLDGDDIVYGSSYADNISGGNGNDIIYGGAGDDTIRGENGNDYLVGGTGNDYLDGGDGVDTYVYNLGDDLNTIVDYEGNETIQLGEQINRDDLTFSQSGNNLLINIGDDSQQGLIIRDYFSSAFYKNKTIVFDDNTTLDLRNSAALIQAMNSFSSTNSGTMDLTSPIQNVTEMYDIACNSSTNKNAA